QSPGRPRGGDRARLVAGASRFLRAPAVGRRLGRGDAPRLQHGDRHDVDRRTGAGGRGLLPPAKRELAGLGDWAGGRGRAGGQVCGGWRMSQPWLKIGVLLSGRGRGSNMQAIIEACRRGEVPGEVVRVVSTSPGTPALERAKEMGVDAIYVDPS